LIGIFVEAFKRKWTHSSPAVYIVRGSPPTIIVSSGWFSASVCTFACLIGLYQSWPELWKKLQFKKFKK